MKLYVTGCGGMLGTELYKQLSQRHTIMATDKYRYYDHDWLSLADVRLHHELNRDVSVFQPDAILNLAAETDMEFCETYKTLAIDTNTGGSANCAEIAGKLGIPYVYISTAGIFDGEQDSYDDWYPPHPLSVYAKSKYWGELIAQTVPRHIVLRCGWQMGSGPKDKKFIGKIWKQIQGGATELNVVTDKLGTPTYVKDFSLQIEKLLIGKVYGTYNAVCKGNASRYDVAVEFVKLMGLQDKVKINQVDSDFWKEEYFAPRPASEKLLTVALDEVGMNVMRPWQVCLAEYVNKDYPEYFGIKK